MSCALVVLADGFEEIEALAVVDVLRRGAVVVTLASVNKYEVCAAHGVRVVANCLLDQCQFDQYDMIVLPGGMPGAEYLFDSEILAEMLKSQKNRHAYIAAICASPAVVLAGLDLLGNCRATSYPSFANQLSNFVADQNVVVDDIFITSQGPATAIEFGLKLLELLTDKSTAQAIAKDLLVTDI